MSLLQGSGGARPSKAMSLIGAVVGVGMFVCAVLFLVAPDFGVPVFIGLWVLVVLTTIGYHIWNATARHGIDHTRFDFHAENTPRGNSDFAERLRAQVAEQPAEDEHDGYCLSCNRPSSLRQCMDCREGRAEGYRPKFQSIV